MSWHVVDKNTGVEVLPGDQVTSFRGEPAKIVRISRLPGGASQGKIIVKWSERDQSDELYPSVFNLVIGQ